MSSSVREAEMSTELEHQRGLLLDGFIPRCDLAEFKPALAEFERLVREDERQQERQRCNLKRKAGY